MLELVYRLLVFLLVIYFAVPTSGIKTFQCKAITFIGTRPLRQHSSVWLSWLRLDRYQSIVHPLKKLKSENKSVFLLGLVWLYAAILSCPFVLSIDSISVLDIPEARGMACEDCADKKLCDIQQNPLGQSSTTLFSFFHLLSHLPPHLRYTPK